LVVPHVQRYLLYGETIAGEAQGRYWLVDTAGRLETGRNPKFFASASIWRRSLWGRGVPVNVELLSPDQVADSLSAPQTHPWRYRVMHNLLGLDDNLWGFLVIAGGFLASFLLGLVVSPEWYHGPLSVTLGVCTALIGGFVIQGGGAGPRVGMLLWPLLCRMLLALGRTGRRGLQNLLADGNSSFAHARDR